MRSSRRIGYLADQLTTRAWDRYQYDGRRRLMRNTSDVAACTHDVNAVDTEPAPSRVVVEQRDRKIRARWIPQHRPDDLGAPFSGAEHDKPLHISAGRTPRPIVVCPRDVANRAHQHESAECGSDRRAQRDHARMRCDQVDCEDERGRDHDRAGERGNLVEAPHARTPGVETRDPCTGKMAHDDDGNDGKLARRC